MKPRKKREGKQEEDTTNIVVESDGEVMYLTIDEDSCLSTSTSGDTEWVVDSGACFHVTPHRDYFSSYNPCSSGEVRMGNSGT